eukprot:755289-Hanusia_phi.AAC.1
MNANEKNIGWLGEKVLSSARRCALHVCISQQQRAAARRILSLPTTLALSSCQMSLLGATVEDVSWKVKKNCCILVQTERDGQVRRAKHGGDDGGGDDGGGADLPQLREQ